MVYNLLLKLFKEDRQMVFNRMLSELELDQSQATVKNLVQIYRNHQPQITFFPDVLPAIEKLHQQKIRTGIITDGYYQAQLLKIQAVKADQYFDPIICTDKWGVNFWKPHPQSFEAMRSELQLQFEEMVYVGDNPAKDFYIGAVVPIKTIRILRGGVHDTDNYYQNIKETARINSLSKLNEVMMKFDRLLDQEN
jgi:putative hydrolase of the HAD superfamily